jgi:hypothetical protein
VVIDVFPHLDREPARLSAVLRSAEPIDLYLIAIGALNDLVVRHDQRKAAIKALAEQAEWSTRTLRQTALRARLSKHVHGDRLTAKGWAQAAAGSKRLTRLGSQA